MNKRTLAAAALLAVSVWAIAASLEATGQVRNYVIYWAGGRQLIEGANPYDPGKALALETSPGFSLPRPGFVRNLPWFMTLTVPLGLMSYQAALFIWFIAIGTSLFLSERCLWIMDGRPSDRGRYRVAYLFAPVLMIIASGQTGAFLLLALVGFLYFVPRRAFYAGACVAILATKPHLVLPFAAVLAAWAWHERAWKLAAGFLAGVALLLAPALMLRPQLLYEYSAMVKLEQGDIAGAPCLMGMLHLGFLPALLASGWGIYYYWQRPSWNWANDGQILLLLGLAAAPYVWPSDEVLLIPAIVAASRGKRDIWVWAALNGVVYLMIFGGVRMTSGWYAWTPLGWLGWYLYATKRKRVQLKLVDLYAA